MTAFHTDGGRETNENFHVAKAHTKLFIQHISTSCRQLIIMVGVNYLYMDTEYCGWMQTIKECSGNFLQIYLLTCVWVSRWTRIPSQNEGPLYFQELWCVAFLIWVSQLLHVVYDNLTCNLTVWVGTVDYCGQEKQLIKKSAVCNYLSICTTCIINCYLYRLAFVLYLTLQKKQH